MIRLISVFFAIEKHHFCNMAVCLLIHFSRSCFKRVANMKKKKKRFKLSYELRMWIEQCPSTLFMFFSSYICYCYKYIEFVGLRQTFSFHFLMVSMMVFFLKNYSALSLNHVLYQFTWFDQARYSVSLLLVWWDFYFTFILKLCWNP